MSPLLINWLLGALLLLVGVIAVALLRLMLCRSLTDQILCIQLLGIGGTAMLLLMATLLQQPALIDVALLLVLLAAVMVLVITRRECRDE
ncbi:multiple resistance and pH regulation protein F [Motiliproteus coralliicola]|uniref:Multiple resistance and pH regulation protein F n=1 Tax=Motiliproteus coralliicola TaxID=2283196 RepID=A0A369WPN9_9GAMM|nr:monovalent cation/H+ antiporter complex subunit F [Motiliproteus coralliicola]RDE24058.1 multiple resistance and pH regulation protein F [Motiliproteus coralliicola]